MLFSTLFATASAVALLAWDGSDTEIGPLTGDSTTKSALSGDLSRTGASEVVGLSKTAVLPFLFGKLFLGLAGMLKSGPKMLDSDEGLSVKADAVLVAGVSLLLRKRSCLKSARRRGIILLGIVMVFSTALSCTKANASAALRQDPKIHYYATGCENNVCNTPHQR